MGLFDNPNDNPAVVNAADKYDDGFRARQLAKQVVELEKATPPEEKFEYDKALKAGYKPEEVIDHLKAKGAKFDFDGAIQAGYKPEEIISHLNPKAQEAKQKIEHAKAKAKTEGMSDFELGVAKTMTGVAKTVNDILHLLHIRDDEEHAQRFKEVNEWSQTYKAAMESNDVMSMGTLGEMLPSLITLPVSAQSKLALFAIEGVVGYATERAESGVTKSLGAGALSGGLAAGGAKAIDMILGTVTDKAQKGVFEYYRNQMNYTEDEIDAVYKEWLKTMEPSGNVWADKTKAMLDYSGEKGAAIKAQLAKRGSDEQKALDSGRMDRIRNIRKLIDEPIEVEEVAKDLVKAVDTVKTNYGKVKWEISNSYKPMADVEYTLPKVELPEVLDDIATDHKAIKELLANPTAIDYIDAMPHINSILSRSKGVHKAKWAKVKEAVEKNLQDTLSTDDYIKWKAVNADYADAMRIYNSKTGEALARAVGEKGNKSQITSGRVLELLKADKDSGEFTFESAKRILGGEKTAKLERLVIKDIFGNHADDVSWGTISKSLRTKGFVSEEGKQFQEIMDNLSRSFRTDDALGHLKVRLQNSGDTGGLGYNLIDKFKVSLAGRLFRTILKYSPTKGAEALRMEDKLSYILTKPSKVKEIHRAINTLGEGVKERMVEQTLADMPKLLEYKPRAEIKAKIAKDNSVLPTTKASVGVNTQSLANYISKLSKELGISNTDAGKLFDFITDDKFIGKLQKFSGKARNDLINREAKKIVSEIDSLKVSDVVKIIKEVINE